MVVVRPFLAMMRCQQLEGSGWNKCAAVSGRAPGTPLGLALTHGFVQADRTGHTDVKAFNRTQHGYGHEFVAGFSGKPAHAFAFRAHDPRHGTTRIDLMHAGAGLVI